MRKPIEIWEVAESRYALFHPKKKRWLVGAFCGEAWGRRDIRLTFDLIEALEKQKRIDSYEEYWERKSAAPRFRAKKVFPKDNT